MTNLSVMKNLNLPKKTKNNAKLSQPSNYPSNSELKKLLLLIKNTHLEDEDRAKDQKLQKIKHQIKAGTYPIISNDARLRQEKAQVVLEKLLQFECC